MRYGWVTMLVLALGTAACSKAKAPEPEATGSTPPMEAAPISAETPADTATGESSAAATAPAPTATSAPPLVPAKLSALGTEPFWNARIDGNTLTYTTPEDQAGKRITIERRNTAIGAIFSGTLDGAPLVLTVTRHSCSDGMSDRAYPLRTVLTIGSQRQIGCASQGKAGIP